jgi:hypothetical protein
MGKRTMEIDNETFQEILWDDHEDFESVTDTEIEDKSRWSIYKSCVYKQKSTGKFFEAYWGEGATEYQEGQNEDWSFTEVEPKEVIQVVYSAVKGGTRFEGNM